MRVAAIDSGVNAAHPHVQPIAGGIHITADGTEPCYTDFLGHGTAVAGAIREKAPAAEIYAVKVFDRQLVTSGQILLRALAWCLDHRMDFVNLSLGTLNATYRSAFEELIARAREQNTTVIAAYEMNEQPAFPGSLEGVAGVVLHQQCPRTCYMKTEKGGRMVYAASGYPRDIPGVPPRHNLQGISFAVANVTGFLAAGVSP
jgi:subtilisin family serine protease